MSIRSFEGKKPALANNVFVDETAVVIGEVTLGEDCGIWPQAVLRADIHPIIIGARSNIQDGSVVHVNHDGPYYPGGSTIIIGEDVTVGHNVILHGCRIGNFCLIGMGSIVMDDAILKDEVMIGAGSLVPQKKTLESGYLWVGNPVQKRRPLTETEKNFLRYSAQHYVKLKNRHMADSLVEI